MQLGVSEILSKASTIQNRNERINYLRSNGSKAILIVLQYALDPNIALLGKYVIRYIVRHSKHKRLQWMTVNSYCKFV